MSNDRILGLVVVLGALAFIAGALSIQTSFLTDPVGTRAFPIIIGVAGALCGLVMLISPDENPQWPGPRAWISMAAATLLLIGYAYGLSPLGFLLSTALAASGISWLIQPRAPQAIVTGVGLSGLLFVVFKYGLGLGLFALPRAFYG